MTKPADFIGKYVIQGTVHCKTGLHIGATDEGIEIGGVDNAVIKDPLTEMPYIPGSALKGKMRSICEWSLGLIDMHPKHKGYAAYDCHELKRSRDAAQDPDRWDRAYTLARLFGPASDESDVRTQAGPTRLTVRDAFLSEGSQEELQRSLGPGTFTEIKTENALDRVTSAANPRPVERVPAGTEFDLTLIVDIYDPTDKELLRQLFGAMAVLEDSTLGGGGSRGHGQVEFRNLKAWWRPLGYYTVGASPEEAGAVAGMSVREIAANFDAGNW